MEDAQHAHARAEYLLQEDGTHRLRRPELEAKLNELAGDDLRANAEPIEPSEYKEPFQYYEPSEGTGGLPAVVCTCGWSKHHLRFKVLQKASERHYHKTGHNTKPQKG